MEAGTSSGAGNNGTAETAEEIQQTQSLAKAKKIGDELVIGAEKFKATVAPPKTGMELDVDKIISQIRASLTDVDDEFFHITCHIDPQLKEKIQKGVLWSWRNYYLNPELR